jgi:hypothetical protein
MSRPRRQSSLAEVYAALRPLEKVGVKPDSTIFNDLQSGTLVTEVRFPRVRPRSNIRERFSDRMAWATVSWARR